MGIKRNLILLAILITNGLYAQVGIDQKSADLKKFVNLYKSAQYIDALEALKEVDETKLTAFDRAYFLGITHSRLQQYDEAIKELKIASRGDCRFSDVFYEYGQALFGNNEIKAARDAFKVSALKGFNPTASIYYIAHTSELLEEWSMAKFYYHKLIKDPKTDKRILQVSFFQYAKILLNLMRAEERKLRQLQREDITERAIPRYILPLLKKSLSIDPESEVAQEISKLIADLTKEYYLDPDILFNGKKLSSTRYYSYFTFRTKYDNNYSSTKRGATSFESTLYYKYDFTAKKKFIITPDLRLTYNQYKNQKESLFYGNDSFSLGTSLRTRYEHRLFNKQAATLIDFGFSKNYRDLDYNHTKKPAYYSFDYSLGETFTLFKFGDTTIKIKNSEYVDARDKGSNSRTFSTSIDQTAFLSQGMSLLLASFDLSLTDNYNNPYSNSNSYSLRLTYLMFEILPSYTLQFGHSLTITDPKKLRPERGLEFGFNPSVEISKQIFSNLSFATSFGFYSNKSKQAAYRSDKQTIDATLTLNF